MDGAEQEGDFCSINHVTMFLLKTIKRIMNKYPLLRPDIMSRKLVSGGPPHPVSSISPQLWPALNSRGNVRAGPRGFCARSPVSRPLPSC